jgi:hypothetical protein
VLEHQIVERVFRRHRVGWLEPVADLGVGGIQRHRRHAAAVLQRRRPLALVRQEVTEQGEQERPEPPLGPIDRVEEVATEEIGEKGLRQIAGRIGVVAAAADVGVEREPIRPAQRLERRLRLALGSVARLQTTCHWVVANWLLTEWPRYVDSAVSKDACV